jgi:hypothetical protein
LGWTCGLRSPSRIGLELGLILQIRWHWPDLWLDLDFEDHSLIVLGLGLGLGLRGPTRIGLGLGLGLRSPTRNWTWTSGPENRTLVKSAAAESDFGFGLGLRALPWWQGGRCGSGRQCGVYAGHDMCILYQLRIQRLGGQSSEAMRAKLRAPGSLTKENCT